MINKIMQMKERGERVSLECIDPDGYLSSIKHESVRDIMESIIKSNDITVDHVYSDDMSLRVKYCNASKQNTIFHEELKYFKIKQPTFNDLIEVAKKAVQDDILSSFTVNDMDYSDLIGRAIYIGLGMRAHRIANEIKRIQSLYTETFVIESEEDIEKLCDDAEITLANNEKGIFNNCSGLRSITNLKTGFEVHGLNIFWLKGATVTQEVSK